MRRTDVEFHRTSKCIAYAIAYADYELQNYLTNNRVDSDVPSSIQFFSDLRVAQHVVSKSHGQLFKVTMEIESL